MLGHVPFNLCEVHELSRVALYIRQQALFTLIQRNPAHQVPYDPDTIRQMVQMIQVHLPHRAARLVRDMLTSTGPTEVTMLFMIGLTTRACLLWQFRSLEHLLNPSRRVRQHFTEHGQYALEQVPGLSCSVRLVVVNIEATEIDAAQPPLDANNDDNGDNDDVHDRTSDGALDLIVDSRPGPDTVSQTSVHDNATIATHHRPSLPATTLPVGSRASARQTRDATPLHARWAPGPSDDGHSNSSPVHLSQMTHEKRLHAGQDSVRCAFRHTPFHLVERLFPQPPCVRASQIGTGIGLWNDSEEIIQMHVVFLHAHGVGSMHTACLVFLDPSCQTDDANLILRIANGPDRNYSR